MKNLLFNQTPVFDKLEKHILKKVDSLSNEYIQFLSKAKTERTSIKVISELLKKYSYKKIELYQDSLKELPNKFFIIFQNKNLACVNLENADINNGINFLISHIDAPRIDLKQNPLIEMSNLLMFKTHYYGGIKKYQWLNIPLALYGIIMTKEGKKIEVSIGDNANDPIFVIPDLAIHLSSKMIEKKMNEAITGEMLNAVAGSIYSQHEKKENQKIKLYALNILNKKYGIKETDFLTAELQFVPAISPRYAGFDLSLIAGYGHDDRSCAFASLKALLDYIPQKTNKAAVSIFYDKEEIGSDGSTGAKSRFIEDVIYQILEHKIRNFKSYYIRKILLKSNVISADVNTAINPNFPEVFENQNCSKLGYGVVITKFTGSRGKSGASEANTEYLNKLTAQFAKDKVKWQIGEIGKVDEGGGGTIAKFIAKYGCNVVDCGLPVMSMHSPFELISKFDLYSAHTAYKSFLKLK